MITGFGRRDERFKIKRVEVPTQLRTYTCAFLADVANGQAEMRTYINHHDLIAGPGGGR